MRDDATHVTLSQRRRSRRQEPSLLRLGAGAAAVLAGCGSWSTTAARDDSGAVVEFGQVELSDIRVGDCLVGNRYARQVASMEAIPCTDAHIYETFAVFDIERSGEFPGSATDEIASRGCLAQWESAVGTVFEDDMDLELSFVYPSRETWADGDRRVICFLSHIDGSPLLETRLNR